MRQEHRRWLIEDPERHKPGVMALRLRDAPIRPLELRGVRPDIAEVCSDFIGRCLKENPPGRPSAAELE